MLRKLVLTIALALGLGSAAPAQQVNYWTQLKNYPSWSRTVDATLYGVQAQAHRSCNAKITSGQHVVTTASTDIPFTSADIGKIIWVNTGVCSGQFGANTGGVSLAKSTITGFTDAHTVTTSGTASITCSAAPGCEAVWGFDETTQLNNAWAALNATGTACGELLLPPGGIISYAVLSPTTNCGTRPDIGLTGPFDGISVRGVGEYATTIYPPPDMDGASCTGQGPFASCYFAAADGSGLNQLFFHDFSINGSGQNSMTNAGGHTAISLGANSLVLNVAVINWNNAVTNFTSLFANGAEQGQTEVINFGSWNGGAMVFGGWTFTTNSAVFTYGGNQFINNGLQNFISNSFFCSGSANNTFTMQNGTAAQIENSILQNLSANSLFLLNSTGITLKLFNNNIGIQSNGSFINYSSNADTVIASGNSVLGPTGNMFLGLATGSVYSDGGLNTYPSTTATSGITPTCAVTGAGSGATCSIVAGSTNKRGTIRITAAGSPSATGTVTITFAGTLAGSTVSGPFASFAYANTGTGSWSATAIGASLAARSATAPVLNWSNNGTNLSASSTYDIDYSFGAN